MASASPALAGAERRCQMCHDFTTGKNGIGPSLKGILGRKAGTYPGYNYTFTKYIKGEPWVWTEDKLRQWDEDSGTAVKVFTGDPNARTKMPRQAFTGLEEDNVITYIKMASSGQVVSDRVFANVPCKMCHDFTTGENRIGPSLKGVLGRKAGTYPGYKYTFTKYIKGEPWVWTEERLREWDNNSERAIKKFTGNPSARTLMPPQHRMGADEDEIISFIKITSEIPNKTDKQTK
ncbi:MAG TPA: cytochrome c [Mariprofundaceae bacterium]|nr:cytochrome c [Mariprofundaceae bacterium]